MHCNVNNTDKDKVFPIPVVVLVNCCPSKTQRLLLLRGHPSVITAWVFHSTLSRASSLSVLIDTMLAILSGFIVCVCVFLWSVLDAEFCFYRRALGHFLPSIRCRRAILTTVIAVFSQQPTWSFFLLTRRYIDFLLWHCWNSINIVAVMYHGAPTMTVGDLYYVLHFSKIEEGN